MLLCTAAGCANDSECFQPVDKPTLVPLAKNGRNFVPSWYKAYPWLSVCTTNCLLLHAHKDLTDNIDLLAIAKEFIAVGVTNERRNYFGVFP